jgi:hypothetical protein
VLAQRLTLGGLQGEGGERLTGAAALLHRAETVFDAFGERLAAGSLNALHELFNAAVGPDVEADGALGHPERETVAKMLTGFGGLWRRAWLS